MWWARVCTRLREHSCRAHCRAAVAGVVMCGVIPLQCITRERLPRSVSLSRWGRARGPSLSLRRSRVARAVPRRGTRRPRRLRPVGVSHKILAGCGGSVSLLVRPMFTLLYFTLLAHFWRSVAGDFDTRQRHRVSGVRAITTELYERLAVAVRDDRPGPARLRRAFTFSERPGTPRCRASCTSARARARCPCLPSRLRSRRPRRPAV